MEGPEREREEGGSEVFCPWTDVRVRGYGHGRRDEGGAGAGQRIGFALRQAGAKRRASPYATAAPASSVFV